MEHQYEQGQEWAFIRTLLENHPAILEGLVDDLQYYEDLPAATLFFGDVAEWVAGSLVGEHLSAEAAAVLQDLEAVVAAGPSWVEDLIAVGFIENLPYPHQPGGSIACHLGPAMREELERQRGPIAEPQGGRSWHGLLQHLRSLLRSRSDPLDER
jgi:hypothetical protein